MACFIK